MPLYKSFRFDDTTQILLWDITESLEDLYQTAISDSSLLRLSAMKSDLHKRGFLSVRMLLQHAGYSDHDLFYDEFGKPHLKEGKHISISHSHQCSAVIVSDKTVGIDLELRRDKIAKIADKFVEPSFVLEKTSPDYINKLTVNWGAKEAIFKIRNEKGISFKDHIDIKPFEMRSGKTEATLHFDKLQRHFDVYFEEPGNYTLVYVFEQ